MFSLQNFFKKYFFNNTYSRSYFIFTDMVSLKKQFSFYFYWKTLDIIYYYLSFNSPVYTPILLKNLNFLLTVGIVDPLVFFKFFKTTITKDMFRLESLSLLFTFSFTEIKQRAWVSYLFFRYKHKVKARKTIFGFKGLPVNFTADRRIPTFSLFSNFKYINFTVFYKNIKTLILPVLISVSLGFILLDYYNINFVRQVAVWAVVGLLFFWLFSGFNFFLKRYRFGKFTSAIQRFWKRANTYFWLIEGFLFSLFFYYYLNSSQEVNYFFDEASLNQTYLPNLCTGYFSLFFLLIISVYSYYVMLNLQNFVFKQIIFHIKVISLLMIVVFLLECYQFYYVITAFFELNWTFNPQTNLWVIEWFSPKLRVKHQYFLLALIAKYWHFLFIFFSWLFVIMKCFEQKRLHYTLFGVNVQNCLLLILLNLLFYAGWVKWLVRRFGDVIYFWFFTDYNNWNVVDYLNECFLLTLSLVSF